MSNPLAPNPPAADAAATADDDLRPVTPLSGWNMLTYQAATGLPTALHRAQLLRRDTLRRMAKKRRGR